MTEDEAKTKWCPFARGITDHSGNRMAYGGAGGESDTPECQDQYAAEMADLYPCMGSACMAWRWGEKPNPEWRSQGVSMGMFPPRDSRFDEPMYIADETQGYCGLAGRAASR